MTRDAKTTAPEAPLSRVRPGTNRRVIALVVAALFAAGCGGGSGAVPPSLTPLPASSGSAAVPIGAGDGGTPSSVGTAGSGATAGGVSADDPTDDESATSDDSGEIDDGAESPLSPGQGQLFKHPFEGLSQQKLESQYAQKPESLGSISVGYTNGGALVNGVQMPAGDGWELVDADHAWGTRETIDYVVHSMRKVSELLPGAPRMYIGHVSARRGGHLSPHVSHQAGRDVDISYYYLPGEAHWYATARAKNLDLERTWAFVKTLITDTDIELILMDRAVQRMVRRFAVQRGEDSAWVDQIFDGGGGLPPLIRHAKGHATHLHLRFYNPIAQETGRRLYDVLVRRQLIAPASRFVHHKVKEGETLGHLAKKYGVSPKAIQEANGMKSNLIRATQDYKIPQRGGVRGCPKLTVVPARRSPPEHRTG
jgi:penicillin-insensitive murein endopeptidase